MTVFLDGIAARFYRGIGEETQFISPFSRINFFIGENNSGKSIVLNLLATQLSNIVSDKKNKPLEGTEIHKSRKSGNFLIAIGANESRSADRIIETFKRKILEAQPRTRVSIEDEIRAVCSRIATEGHLWMVPDASGRAKFFPWIDQSGASSLTKNWFYLWISLTQFVNGGAESGWIEDSLSVLAASALPKLPPIYLVPAKRQLGLKDETFNDLSGRGLIDHLATLQNPKWNRQEDREKFHRINRFLQDVTGKADANLEVPSDRAHLLVHMDNKVLPLHSLGTGIHEVILIAAFCTIYDEVIMCLEEPEIHLHPLLQKKIINYLVQNTRSQYFIATHSAAFIDTPDASVFHVINDGQQTSVRAVVTRNDQRKILDELGYLASDILQANSIIWVEGPSDRIYLSHWISSMDPDLKEGIHYTIMFYGGSLISHLTASDKAFDEFIKLRDLNRNMAIVLDSDKETLSTPLKVHAQRLVDEMKGGPGVIWVTAGREVENYVDGKKLQLALKTIHPKLYQREGKTGQFDHAFYFYCGDPKQPGGRLKVYKAADKVGVARYVCEDQANLDILDLRVEIERLVAMIRKANGLQLNQNS